MDQSPVYHTVNVFIEDRFLISLDFKDKAEAVRESISFQKEGFKTEFLTLSTAPLFDCAPDDYNDNVERIAY